MKKALLLVLVWVLGSQLNGQNTKLDSLIVAFQQAKHDTTRGTIYVLFTENLYLSKPDTIIPLCIKAIALCDKNLPTAGAAEKKAFLNIKASAFNNIGYIYQNYGDNIKALDNYHAGLKIQEEIGDKKGLAQSLNNIGFVYQAENDRVNALNYYLRSLKIRESINDKRGIGESLNNLGYLYRIFGDPDCKSQVEEVCKHSGLLKGIEYYEKSLKIKEAIRDSVGIGISLNNLGTIYITLKELDKALDNFKRSYEIRKSNGDLQGMANALSNIGSVYFYKKNYKEAITYGEQSLKISNELGFPSSIKNAADVLQKAYYFAGDFKKAFDTYRLYIHMRDSLNSQIINKAAQKKQMQYEYEKKVAADSMKIANEKSVVEVKLQKAKSERFALIGGLMLVIVFAIFMFNRYRITQQQKKLIEIKEQETQQQKTLIEDKQKEIVDSINYAQRIQRTLLASEQLLNENLPEHFVLYKPKAIVSGDFYWGARLENVKSDNASQVTTPNPTFYLAVCDSTGHGVPGAFMSLLNISFLNEAINERYITSPAQILNHVRQRIIQNLSSEGGKDGMDCSLVAFDFSKNKLVYAAANNPIWVVRQSPDKNIIELSADKMPVGKYEREETSFKESSFDLVAGDMVYMFTDGYADQFGGPKGKKFMYKQLQKVMLSIADLKPNEQKNILQSTFEDWKKDLEQVDDVCIIGVKVEA